MGRIVGQVAGSVLQAGNRNHTRAVPRIGHKEARLTIERHRNQAERLSITHVANGLPCYLGAVLSNPPRDEDQRAARVCRDQRVLAIYGGEAHGADRRPGPIALVGDMVDFNGGRR